MTPLSPFEVARATANQAAAGIRSYQDTSLIDRILDEASRTGNPEDIDFAMSKIISKVSPERQQMALALLQKKRADIQSKNEKEQYRQALIAQGHDPGIADLSSEGQKEYFKSKAKEKEKNAKKKAYQDAKLPEYYADLDPITQRTLLQNQANNDFFSQILSGVSPQGVHGVQGVPASEPMATPRQIPPLGQVPEEMASTDIGNLIDQYSPAQPQQRQPVGMERFSDQQLVAMRGIKGSSASAMADAELKRRQSNRDLSLKEREIEEKGIDRSYDAQKDFIENTTRQYRGWETEMKPRLLQMQSMPSDQIIGPTASKFLEALGIPLGALENPSSELYNKLSQDLLKGLPDTYGNRILKVEVDNFLKTIPTLANSPDGRRMIASNMLKLGQMKEVFYKEMRRQQMEYIDQNKRFPRDFEQRVFDNVKPQIDKLNNQFVRLAEVKSVPKGTIPYFDPQGLISFVPNNPEDIKWAEENGGERIW